jgi:uncharacterized protein with GYD domain
MAKYIVLANWTDQGIRSVKDSAKRLDAGFALARQPFGSKADMTLTLLNVR